MKQVRILFPTIMLLLFLGSNVFARGYRVLLQTEKGDTSEYVLSGWKWGDKVYLDTVKASKGKAAFRGKEDLACGSYAVSELSGRKLVEFIVPRENRNFGITFQRDGKGYNVKKGNAENKLFSGFLNFLDYGWEELDSADEFAVEIEEFRSRAASQLPGTVVDIILGNTLFTPESAEELRKSFPFGDTIILNTQFAEDKVEQYLRLLQYNHNDTIIKYVDSLIAGGGNRELQSRIAHTAYDFFYNSSIMGQEGVAHAEQIACPFSEKLRSYSVMILSAAFSEACRSRVCQSMRKPASTNCSKEKSNSPTLSVFSFKMPPGRKTLR